MLANNQISLDVNEGEILAILGPNGAGKTTLVKQMVGHIQPTSGSITLLGRDVVRQPDWAPTVAAYYPQVPLALSHLTTTEALTFTGRLRGMRSSNARQQAAELVAQLGLGPASNRQLRSLSGGQQRLVGIGTALIGRLPVLVFDEPTNELDPANRRLVWDLIRRRNQMEGTTVLVVTHNVLEAELVVDRVAIIDHGRLLAINTVGALKQRVDQRLRLEVTVIPGHQARAEAFLRQFGLPQALSDTRLRLTLNKSSAGRVVDAVIAQAHEIGFEEYRLIPPSLEDVYFAVGGEEVFINGD
ncbi:MAG: ABC transporter ATP-binding protein [Mycobacterium leprae]